MSLNKILVSIFFLSIKFSLSAQTYQLSGSIQDSLQTPLPYVNIIATPLAENAEITFAISGNKGQYELKLVKNTAYKLEITHLGFSKLTDTVSLDSDTVKNYILYESAQSLEEVLIEAEMAVIVKEDTITYRVDNFRTGEERKLKELLEKLPGVEVDRAGNVTVNGKKVTKLLVEGKEFFTGDEKLGVNNIPADAVEEVVALDDYTEVPFLKDLADSDQMALNIKLKEGKKKFVFGDIEAGGGVEARYLFHPTLFYYSSETAVNAIGDFNNIGKKSFTLQDYIDFEGGFATLFEDPTAFFNLYTSDFAQFLAQDDFTYNKNDFGAASLSQEISKDIRLNAYSINSHGKTETKNTQNITYLTQENLTESRLNTTNNDLFFSLNKLELKYTPNYETDLGYEAVIKYSQGDAREFIFSQTPQETNSISAMQKPEMLNISQNLVFNKQFSYEHTSTLTANYTHKKNDNNNNWLFDEPIFSGIIPFVAEDTLNFIQNTNSLVNKARFRLKHYWVLDNKNHIYPVLGLNFNDWNYSTHDFQRLQNGDINSFQDEGFNNRLDFRLVDAYVGFEYKRKLGEIILKPGLVYHYFLWNIQQFGTETANREKGVLLPKIEAEYEISSAKKFRFNYRMATGFSNVSRYADRLRLAGFNQLYRGNADSENELRHQFSLTYYHFNLFKGTFLNAGANYSRKTKSVQETTVLEGIDQIQTAIYSDLPQNSFSLNGTFSKQVGNFKFSLGGNAAIADYSRIVNEVRNNYLSQNYSYTFKTETSFDSFPNFEIGFRQHFNIFESDQDVSGLKNEFMRLDPYFYLDYDFWNGFILKADYFYNYYENKNTGQTNRFQIAGASIYYNKENSPWGFEIRVENLFDVRYKNKNSFSQFLVLDKNIYIQPRTMLFVLSYKL